MLHLLATSRRAMLSFLWFIFAAAPTLTKAADFQVRFLITERVIGTAFPVYKEGDKKNQQCTVADLQAEMANCVSASSQCIGGAARRYSKMESVRAASGVTNVVAWDMGSYFFGGNALFYPTFQGEASSWFFGGAGYDGFGLAWRDFIAGVNADDSTGGVKLAQYLANVRTRNQNLLPAVTTNFNVSGDPHLTDNDIAPYRIMNLADGRRLAFLSLIDPMYMTVSAHYKARVESYPFYKSIQTALGQLRNHAEGLPDVVLLSVPSIDTLTDAALQSSSGDAARASILRSIVEASIGVNIVIAGTWDSTGRTVYKNWLGQDVVVVTVDQKRGISFDDITVTFTDSGEFKTAGTVTTHELDCTVPSDNAIHTKLLEYEEQISTSMGVTLGHLSSPAEGLSLFTGECTKFLSGAYSCGCNVAECSAGNLLADAVLWFARTQVSDVQFALVNGGAIAGSLSSLEVTKTDVFSILPYANNVVVLRVPGSVVESVVENSLTGFLRTDVETHPDGRFLQVSPGLRFRWYYDTASKTPVLKIVEVLNSTTGQFALLDKAATYVIAVSSFMATGGDDYSMLEEYYENGMEPPIHEQKAWQYAMEEYLKAVAPSGSPLTSHTVNADASQRRIQQVSEPARVDLALLCHEPNKELCDALLFAVNLVNNKTSGFLPNILSSVRLVPHVTYTPCTATVKEPIADLKAGIIASAGSWPGAAIGPFCTDETEIFTTAAGSTTVYFSYGASTPSLADDNKYPNLIRTITPENLANRGYVAIMKKYKWTKIGIVSTGGSKWAEQSGLDLLEQFTASEGVVLNSDQMGYDSSSEQPADIMGRLQSVRARIVALWLFEGEQRDIYSYLFQTGLWEGALISCFASTSILQTPSGGVDTGAVSGATGLIALLPKAAGSVLSPWVASWGSNASQSECTQTSLCCCDSDGDKASLLPYTQLALDAFMLYVRALDRVSVNDLNDGTKIYEQVLQLSDSQGISGSVSLDSHGDRLGNFDFLNLQVIDTTQRRLTAKRGLLARVPLTSTSAEFVVVGEYDEATDELKMTDAQAKSVKFPGGQSCPVPGELPCVEDEVPESPGTVVEEFNYIVVIIIIACIIVGFCCILACFQYNYKRQIFFMRQDLDELKKTMVGVEAVVQDFDPHILDGGVMMAPVAEPKTAYRSYWYWQEDSSRLKAHNQNDIFPPNFVKYAGSVNAELETAWNAFRDGTGPSKFKIDLTERIASTGTERKAYAEDSGCNFEIDLTQMKQVNVKTGHTREILRREEIMTPNIVNEATRSIHSNAIERKNSRHSTMTSSKTTTNSVGKSENDFTERPDDLRGEPFLILFVGQIVQTSQKRPDGWTFGSVIFDEVQDRQNVPRTPSAGSIDDPDESQGISSVSGWFPKICVDKPSSAQMKKLHEVMGGHGANVLAAPSTWTEMKDAQKYALIPLADGKEKQDCIDAFKKTLKPNVKVNSVSRVQNVSLWQSYSVKKQTMMSLAAKNDPPVERVWLFHGTSSESVPKILQSGFNRSFCGKNATFYGKGAYFARDASYSAQPAYCTPDTNGVQRVFLCKVAVGSYCLGKKDAPAPDIKEGITLYDSTVDNMRDPSIYVTYHDGQAYPDYLLEFTQPN